MPTTAQTPIPRPRRTAPAELARPRRQSIGTENQGAAGMLLKKQTRPAEPAPEPIPGLDLNIAQAA